MNSRIFIQNPLFVKSCDRFISVACVCLLALMVCVAGSVFAANNANGGKLYQKLGCVGCHGDGGVSKLTDYPSLSNRSASFVASELNKYRNGIRKDPTMNAMAVGLSDEDIEDIAAYISTK